jgi:hypothetical protein
MPRIQLAAFPVAALTAALMGLAAGQAAAHGDEDHSQDKKVAVIAKPASTGGMSVESVSALRLPDGSLFVPKGVQRQLGLRHVVAEVGELAATVEFNGKVIADPNAGGRIQATQSGRIETGPKGLPTLGQKVTKGQVLAYLRPTASSIERGNQQAQFAELEAQLAIAERKLIRYEQLEGAVPQKEIEAARFEAEALKKRRAAVGASVGAAEPLRAPVSGMIAAANVVAGQVVEAKEVLFEVVDPARLAVEALAYDPALADGIGEASAPLSGGVLKLQFVGGGLLLRDQAMPLLFRVVAQDAPVAVGQPLKVIAKTTRTTKGAAVPQSALVKVSAGETAIWVRDGAERFVLRKVRIQSLDAVTAAVTSGLANGERVVTDGAGLLAQVR